MALNKMTVKYKKRRIAAPHRNAQLFGMLAYPSFTYIQTMQNVKGALAQIQID